MPEYIPEGSHVRTKKGDLYTSAVGEEASLHSQLQIKGDMIGTAEGPDPEDLNYQIFAFDFEGEGRISVTVPPDQLEVVS